MHVLALAGLTVLVLVGAVVVLWTEPYPSMLIGLVLLALALFGAWRLSRRVAMALATLLLLSTAVIAISQLRAYTPPITDASGNVLAGSIASLEQVRLGGVDQWVVIRGNNTANPILLFLSGGPGGSELPWCATIWRRWNPISPSSSGNSAGPANRMRRARSRTSPLHNWSPTRTS
jgi:hypothetical protein